ncbi:MAG: hybrid sensor histidine kinase/response regulator, partial [Rubrivivax sp.]|nr:hybrid sensor histidine kinase/response regulator [Rubrivivax sp.]
YALLAQLRADAATRHIPVVAVTAQAMREDERRARAAGFADHIAKPIDVARLDVLLAPLGHAPKP